MSQPEPILSPSVVPSTWSGRTSKSRARKVQQQLTIAVDNSCGLTLVGYRLSTSHAEAASCPQVHWYRAIHPDSEQRRPRSGCRSQSDLRSLDREQQAQGLSSPSATSCITLIFNLQQAFIHWVSSESAEVDPERAEVRVYSSL
jgi:hypothetical protein